MSKFPRCLTLEELAEATRSLHRLVSDQLSHYRYVRLGHELKDALSGEDPGRASRLLMDALDDWPKMLRDSLRSVLPDMRDRGFSQPLSPPEPAQLDEYLQWHWLEPIIWREVALQMALEVRGTRRPD